MLRRSRSYWGTGFAILIAGAAASIVVAQSVAWAAPHRSRPLAVTQDGITTEHVVFKAGHFSLAPHWQSVDRGWTIEYITPPKSFNAKLDGLGVLRTMGLPMPMKTPAQRAFWQHLVDHWTTTLTPHFVFSDKPLTPVGSRFVSSSRGHLKSHGETCSNAPWTGYLAQADSDANEISAPDPQQCIPAIYTASTYYNLATGDLTVPNVTKVCFNNGGVGAWSGLGGYNEFQDASGDDGYALIQSGILYDDYGGGTGFGSGWDPFFEVINTFADGPGGGPPVAFSAVYPNDAWNIKSGDELDTFTEYTSSANPADDAAWFWLSNVNSGQFELIKLVGSSGTVPTATGGASDSEYPGPISAYYDGSSSETMVEPNAEFLTSNDFEWTSVADEVTGNDSTQWLTQAQDPVRVQYGISEGWIQSMSSLSPHYGSSYSVSGGPTGTC